MAQHMRRGGTNGGFTPNPIAACDRPVTRCGSVRDTRPSTTDFSSICTIGSGTSASEYPGHPYWSFPDTDVHEPPPPTPFAASSSPPPPPWPRRRTIVFVGMTSPFVTTTSPLVHQALELAKIDRQTYFRPAAASTRNHGHQIITRAFRRALKAAW